MFKIINVDDEDIPVFYNQSIFISHNGSVVIEIKLNEDGSITIPYTIMYDSPHIDISMTSKQIMIQTHSQEEQFASMKKLPKTNIGSEGEFTFKLRGK